MDRLPAWLLIVVICAQAATGAYLRTRARNIDGIHTRIMSIVIFGHDVVEKLTVFASWAQMVNGGLTALGFCGGFALSSCMEHSVIGLGFLVQGTAWAVLVSVGHSWLLKLGRSVDFLDSLHYLAWGIINTFSEHRWGWRWDLGDIEHTGLGILWLCAGLLSVWLTCRRSTRPVRSLIPALTLILTGWMFSMHPQEIPFATNYHTAIGYTLMALGITRAIEIALIFKDKEPALQESKTNSFQNLPIYVCQLHFINLYGLQILC